MFTLCCEGVNCLLIYSQLFTNWPVMWSGSVNGTLCPLASGHPCQAVVSCCQWCTLDAPKLTRSTAFIQWLHPASNLGPFCLLRSSPTTTIASGNHWSLSHSLLLAIVSSYSQCFSCCSGWSSEKEAGHCIKWLKRTALNEDAAGKWVSLLPLFILFYFNKTALRVIHV